MTRVPALVACIALAGCVRRDGRNADCRWPGEPGTETLRAGDPGFERHLSGDTEFAEELAIRYMEAHAGPRDLHAAAQAKNHCMGVLLDEIGKTHGITAREAFRFFGKRNLAVDLGLGLPFLALYAMAAAVLIRRMHGNYPFPVMALAALAMGAAALVVGELWFGFAESLRVGNWHLSNRALRLPIAQHRLETFFFAVAVFFGVFALQRRLKS
ncbi:MAG: hypothetical protein U0Q16_13240 [Bryobacteraceae bacterium]